ncbi:MAG: O-antigen ligase family protein [Burkholderiaceae bacterium]|nr:O-antigen ligase family protein [Burkholderiaceae bacterium]
MTAFANARRLSLEAGRWSVLLCLFSAPINKPATNVFIALALICALAGERLGARFQAAARQPVVIGAVVWLLAMTVSAAYAPEGRERWQALHIGIALLYPLIVAMLLETPQWRTRGMLAFGAAVTLILLISWGQFFGVVPQREIAAIDPTYRYTVFHNYTQQGIVFLILGAMAAAFARTEQVQWRRLALWGIAAAVCINVIFLLQSRTSYLIVAPLLLFWAWRLAGGKHASGRQIVIGLAILAACAAAAMATPRFQQRLEQARQDVTRYADKREATSLGIRMELWRRTLPIIADAPLLGHGLGQWAPQFMAETKDFPDYDGFRMHHPHQEALLILSEQGVVGLAVFITLLVLLARQISLLALPHRDFYVSLLLIYVTASLANCLWADFTHRHVFIMLLACIPLAQARSRAGSQSESDNLQGVPLSTNHELQ